MFEKIISNNTSSSQPSSEKEQKPAAAPQRQSTSNSNKNILSADVTVTGAIKFQGEMEIDGKIDGEIETTGSLIIREHARVKAQIKTGAIVVYGKIHGNIVASERVELRRSAEVIGDIKAAVLTVEAGAVFVGNSAIGSVAAKPQSAAQPAKQAAASQTQKAPEKASNA